MRDAQEGSLEGPAAARALIESAALKVHVGFGVDRYTAYQDLLAIRFPGKSGATREEPSSCASRAPFAQVAARSKSGAPGGRG